MNRLILSVTDGKIVGVWGFIGAPSREKFDLSTPISVKGCLDVYGNFEYGFSYRINSEPYGIMFNQATRSICFGDPLAEGSAVEFIENCVAVISDSGLLIALWIKLVKPDEL